MVLDQERARRITPNAVKPSKCSSPLIRESATAVEPLLSHLPDVCQDSQPRLRLFHFLCDSLLGETWRLAKRPPTSFFIAVAKRADTFFFAAFIAFIAFIAFMAGGPAANASTASRSCFMHCQHLQRISGELMPAQTHTHTPTHTHGHTHTQSSAYT